MTMSAAPRVAMRMHRLSGRPAQASLTSVRKKRGSLAPGGRNNIVGKEARYLKGVYFSVVPAFVLRTRFVTSNCSNPCLLLLCYALLHCSNPGLGDYAE